MYQSFKGGLGGIALAKHGRSRAINAENPHGEKGKGGMAASHLGPSRKGSPCLNDIEPGATVTLAEMEGCLLYTSLCCEIKCIICRCCRCIGRRI